MLTDSTRDSGEKIVPSVCSSHCGGQCLLRVHVRDGVITRIDTDGGEEPQFRACLKGRAYRQRVYAPDRLKFPMKRAGARGEGKFTRISWDEALDTVAAEIKRVRDTWGPGAIIFRGGGGDIALLHHRRAVERLLGMAGGYSQTWGRVSFEGGVFASLVTYGTLATRSTRDDLLKSRLIIMWGWDPASTVLDCLTCWYLVRAKESGTRIISVDPRYTNTAAAFADEWVPVRPGTDTALMIAMAYVMVREDRLDRHFLDKYTLGFDRFQAYVLGTEDGVARTPAWAEAITGVPAAAIEKLAREYATIKPAALVAGIAPGRTAYGEQYHRAAITLAAMTGNVGIHGGDSAGRSHTVNEGFPFMKPSRGMKVTNPVEVSAPAHPYSLRALERAGLGGKGRVNAAQIADAVLKGKAGGYPFDYKLLYVMNTNLLNQSPDINKSVRALNSLEFIVVQEQFMTATARYADILLPVNTFLERNDITSGEGTPFFGYMNKAVEPLHESRSQFEIAAALAKRLGVPDYGDMTEDEWLRGFAEEMGIADYDRFRKEAVRRVSVPEPYVAFKKQIDDPDKNPFPTQSGKIEIYSRELAEMGHPHMPPVPKYVETWESATDPQAKKYPLQLITTHFRRRAHSQFETLPWLREVQPQAMLLNPVDAGARGIRDGDLCLVFNDRGETTIPARVTERIMPGVVDIPQGAWYDPDGSGRDRGGCANVLTSDRVSPAGAVPHNTALVQVRKA